MKYLIRTVTNRTPNMKIIKASSELDSSPSSKDNGVITVEAIFQKAGETNANGMIISKQVLVDAVKRKQEDIQRRRLLGELDHPAEIDDVSRLANIELKNVSHCITKLEFDGDYLMGTFETAPTPSGNILSSLIKARYEIGVSFRALTDDDGVDYNSDNLNYIRDFDIVTYDAVQTPAYSDAYVQTILSRNIFPIKHIIKSNSYNAIMKNDEVLYTEDDVRAILNDYTKKLINNIHLAKKQG